ncbi:MAG: ABC transporter ATP-binding protein, partial [Pseudomonadota bacterium]
MTELHVTDLTVTAGDTGLVERASFSLKPGELVAVLGPNGAGKTSLIRGTLGLQQTSDGTAILDRTPIKELSPTERAKRIAYLPQIRPLAWPTRVRDVVALGRFSHGATLGKL